MVCRRTGGVDAKYRGWETRDTRHGTGHRPETSRITGRGSSDPPPGYAERSWVLPQERSDLGGGGPQGRRGHSAVAGISSQASAIGHQESGRESRVASRESRVFKPLPRRHRWGVPGVLPLLDGVPPDGRGRCEASGVGNPRHGTGRRQSGIGYRLPAADPFARFRARIPGQGSDLMRENAVWQPASGLRIQGVGMVKPCGNRSLKVWVRNSPEPVDTSTVSTPNSLMICRQRPQG